MLNYAEAAAYYCHHFNLAHKGTLDNYLVGDETYIKICGKNGFVFFFLSEARRQIVAYHIADSRGTLHATIAMHEATRTAGPEQATTYITDGNPAYPDALRIFSMPSAVHKPMANPLRITRSLVCKISIANPKNIGTINNSSSGSTALTNITPALPMALARGMEPSCWGLSIKFDDLPDSKRPLHHDFPSPIAQLLHKQHLNRRSRRLFDSRHPRSHDLGIVHNKEVPWLQQTRKIRNMLMCELFPHSNNKQQPRTIARAHRLQRNQGRVKGKVKLGQLH